MAVAFAAGLLFSLARKKTGTVTAPVIMHILINLSVSLF
jgi:membrane protease YdiL (CAAX protease family)